MKNSKKLIIATLMLVFAFVAVVSSTYAWFTMQNEASVDTIELDVVASGKDLQISTTGAEGSYGFLAKLGTIDGTISPVTYDMIDGFQKLVLNNGVYEYAAAEAFEPNDTAENDNGYLVYDIWFLSTQEVDVTINKSTTAFTGTNTKALDALRIMFVEVDGTNNEVADSIKIYEPRVGTGSFGEGDYYLVDNSYIAYNSLTTYLNPFDSEEDYYTLNETYFATRKYTPDYSYASDAGLQFTITELEANVAKHIRVKIWIEGWDGDCTTSDGSTFKTYLSFLGL